MTDKQITLKQLPEELDNIFKTFLHSSFDVRQSGLQAGAEVFVNALNNDTPKDTGLMSMSWEIKTKYKDRRYVGSSRIAKGVVYRKNKDGSHETEIDGKAVKNEAREGVPLSNVLEYSEKSPHKGFIRRCFDNNEAAIYSAIKSKIEQGGK